MMNKTMPSLSAAMIALLTLTACGGTDADAGDVSGSSSASESATSTPSPSKDSSESKDEDGKKAKDEKSDKSSKKDEKTAKESQEKNDSSDDKSSEKAEEKGSSDSESSASSLDQYLPGTRALVEQIGSHLNKSPELTFEQLVAQDKYTNSDGTLDHSALQARVNELNSDALDNSESPEVQESSNSDDNADNGSSEQPSPQKQTEKTRESRSDNSGSNESSDDSTDSSSEQTLSMYKSGTRALVEKIAAHHGKSAEAMFQQLISQSKYTVGGVLDHSALQARVNEITPDPEPQRSSSQPSSNGGGSSDNSSESSKGSSNDSNRSSEPSNRSSNDSNGSSEKPSKSSDNSGNNGSSSPSGGGGSSSDESDSSDSNQGSSGSSSASSRARSYANAAGCSGVPVTFSDNRVKPAYGAYDFNNTLILVNPDRVNYRLQWVMTHECMHHLQDRVYGDLGSTTAALGGTQRMERIADLMAIQVGGNPAHAHYTSSGTAAEQEAARKLLAGQKP